MANSLETLRRAGRALRVKLIAIQVPVPVRRADDTSAVMASNTRRAVPGDGLAIARVHIETWQAAARGLLPAEVAQLVEQWSEESRTRRFAKSFGNSRLIPKFRVEEQWSQR